ALHDLEPDDRALPEPLLGPHLLQHPLAPDALVPPRAPERADALHHGDDRQRRHVARALRHRRREPLARLHPVVVAPLHADGVGLVDLRRDDRPLPRAALPLHPPAADDLDLRDAGDPARGENRGGRVTAPKLYGLMAEFERPQDLVEATRKTREEGFTRIDAYSPYPIEALTEALDIHDRKLPALVLGGGILGGLSGFALCYWCSVIDFPLNVGGKPYNS